MEKKIKALYIFSIAAIIAFLGMQAYWLYTRYEYSVKEHEDKACDVIEKTLEEYLILRTNAPLLPNNVTRIQSSYNVNNDIDSAGENRRTVNVTTKILDGRKLLGIQENRNLTEHEKALLATIIADSIVGVEQRKCSLDASSAPSDGIAWIAMKNFELEVQSPFTVEGLDTLLRKRNIVADISLAIADSIIWKNQKTLNNALLHPTLTVTSPYSELERKVAVIDYRPPTTGIIKGMAWTLVLAFVISLFLIVCLVRQIETIARLTRLDKMRNSFITTMIHELKRPISTLKMCVSGVENDKMLADKVVKAELMTGMRTALDNLSAYFSKLRDITFNDVEQIPLNIIRFNLSQVVNDVISTVVVHGNKSVSIENMIDASLEVSADKTHIFNIVSNLIENAVKYSGDKVIITIAGLSTDNGVSILVTDNGMGIADSDISRIFTRFNRGKASTTDIPGMGLGLTYVKLLTEAHGGKIIVDSEIGKGSSFTINLPQ